MRLATIKLDREEVAAVYTNSGLIPVGFINGKFNKTWPVHAFEILNSGVLHEITDWYNSLSGDDLDSLGRDSLSADEVNFAPLYRFPGKIWGIGLNYVEHADELDETTPKGEPGSFMKPFTTVIGHGDTIEIPKMSEKTTGEGELGIIIGKKCKDVKIEDWLSVVAGFTCIIDMTAEDILRRNVRYLTLSKSFDTFFSFGPALITPDEIEDVMKLKVATIINGNVHAENVPLNMTFPPDFLVSFHSRVMTLNPGDIISSGTPGAVKLSDGDSIECRITGFPVLKNSVVDLKAGTGGS